MERQEKIEEIAQRAISRMGILSLLNVLVNNPGLSCWNLLMVFDQEPCAVSVCGRKAWEATGRTVKEDAKGIRLLFPRFSVEEGEVTACFQEVWGYGLESTEGKEIRVQPGQIQFADRISKITGAVWAVSPNSGLEAGGRKGHYDAEQNIFYLSAQFTGEQLQREVLGLYVDYCMMRAGETDQLLRFAVEYGIYEHYRIKHTVVGALFGKLAKYSLAERMDFFYIVRRLYVRIIEDMEGAVLGFYDVAALNEFMRTPDREKICKMLLSAGEGLACEELSVNLSELAVKLSHTDEERIRQIFELRNGRRLFSFPPVCLNMDGGENRKETVWTRAEES